MKHSNFAILLLRLTIGTLFLLAGMGKVNHGWMHSPEPLVLQLGEFHQHASNYQLTYLNNVAIPYASVWSKLITVGEIAVGIALLIGLLTRLAAIVAIFMILNFHAANGNLFSWGFFENPYAALLLAGLLVVFITRAGRWVGADIFLARSDAKGLLW